MLYGEAVGSFSCVVTETQQSLEPTQEDEDNYGLLIDVTSTLVNDYVKWEQYGSAACLLRLRVRMGSPLHSC
jgi:hypothetical protein